HPLVVVGEHACWTDRVAVREVLPGKLLVDDGYSGRIPGIPSVKPATGNQSRLEHLKVLGGHRTVPDRDIAVRKRCAIDVEGKIELPEEPEAHHGRTLDAGCRVNPLQGLRHERLAILSRLRKTHDREAARIVPVVHLQHANEALDEQSRTGQQDDRACEMPHDQQSIQTMLASRLSSWSRGPDGLDETR